MITLSELLTKARAEYPKLTIRYIHPALYVICINAEFEGLDQEQRTAKFLLALGTSLADSETTLSAANIILTLLTPSEQELELKFVDSAPPAYHWIEFLAKSALSQPQRQTPQPSVVHFYGYKGGQARSTVLAMLSKALADDGYRVLAVDADIEAPSLHRQYDTKIARLDTSLLGLVHYGTDIVVQPAYLPKGTSQGAVDLVGCRPSDSAFDLDHAVFALSSALNPILLQGAFKKVLQLGEKYDTVLVDHRSGLGSSILPVTASFPGSVIVFARLDDQSDEADSYFDVLFSLNPEMPGMFVSFSLDPEDSHEKLLGKHRGRIDSLLGVLAKAINLGAAPESVDEQGPRVSAEDILGYWLSWFHDRSFLMRGSPLVENISADNKAALLKIRELVGLQSSKKQQPIVSSLQPQPAGTPLQLTNSGNTDQGLLIQTEALRKLSVPNSPYTYILGRKGTGKTRLVRTLTEKQLAIPLLVADDFPDPHLIKSADSTLKDIAARLTPAEAEKLWWILLDVAVAHPGEGRRHALSEWLQSIAQSDGSSISISQISRRVQERSRGIAYLIDGVETAFNSSQMASFVEGLFRFLGSVQSDSHLAQKVTIRLFIRTDLERRAVENVEQQIEGRSLTLSWDTQSILNFALSRISELEWFRLKFPTPTTALRSQLSRLAEGAVTEPECNDYLLEIFPTKLRRNNLLTLTFLKDYFSEGVGESASFYPRIYDTFLRSIADPNMIGAKASRMTQIEDGRVAQPLIIAAHDYASKEYLDQVVAELKNLVQLSENAKQNEDLVEKLISAFSGLPTPFEFEKCLNQVFSNLPAPATPSRDRVRDALQLMKQVGIFEDRPGYAGWWRVGRLFKTALGMKYVR